MTGTPRQSLYGPLTAAALTLAACITAMLAAVFLDVIVGSITGVLLGAPAVPVGIWVGSRAHRADRPSTPVPDTRAILATLEADAEETRLAAEADFASRIAAAECEALGHDPAPGGGLMDVIAWGFAEPIVAGPRCRRCGTGLNQSEGNENAATGVRMSTDVTLSNRSTPSGDRRSS